MQSDHRQPTVASVAVLRPARPVRPTDADLGELLTLAASVEGDHNPIGRRAHTARLLCRRVPELVETIRQLRGGAR
ncbi:MAG: hypothetical protein ACRDYA_18645 [Egibacteraceae bacterium]